MGMAKLAKNSETSLVTPDLLEDGTLAVIVSGNSVNNNVYKGRIIQRIRDSLYVIGGKYDDRWTSLPGMNMQVRILQPGELIEVT